MSTSPKQPTPDVEKIAFELCFTIEGRHLGGDELKAHVREALVQARASLVADKERLDWLDKHFCVRFGHIIQQKNISDLSPYKTTKTVRQCIDAALTGTEEKE